jgi:dihydrofolate reductase
VAGKVLYHVTMSLDGFIAGPGDSMDWLFDFQGPPPAGAEEVIRTTGAILAGRRLYDLGASRPGSRPYGGAWSGPIFVLTHHPPATEDPAVTFLSGGVRDAVARALEAAGGRNVVLFGASIPGQCIEEGLLDEILVHVMPVLLGDGVRLFARPDAAPVRLEKIGVAESGQLTDLRFRVVK